MMTFKAFAGIEAVGEALVPHGLSEVDSAIAITRKVVQCMQFVMNKL
jgi:hypothetical protein